MCEEKGKVEAVWIWRLLAGESPWLRLKCLNFVDLQDIVRKHSWCPEDSTDFGK